MVFILYMEDLAGGIWFDLINRAFLKVTSRNQTFENTY